MGSRRFDQLVQYAKSRRDDFQTYRPYISYFDNLTSEELDNIKKVLEHFDSKCSVGKEVVFDDVLTAAKESFSTIAPCVKDTFEQVYSIIDFEKGDCFEISDYIAMTQTTVKDNTYLNRYTLKIVLPQKFEECSKYFLGHEFVHAVKDINYDEFRLLFTSIETVPILWELITSYIDGNYNIMARTFTERYNQMLNIEYWYNYSSTFLNLYTDGKVRCGDTLAKDIQMINMETSMYLNSFYYAVSIFQRFLTNQKVVLDGLEKVLYSLITTKQFISFCENLGNTSNEFTFAEGLKKFKLIANNEFKK